MMFTCKYQLYFLSTFSTLFYGCAGLQESLGELPLWFCGNIPEIFQSFIVSAVQFARILD